MHKGRGGKRDRVKEIGRVKERGRVREREREFHRRAMEGEREREREKDLFNTLHSGSIRNLFRI